MTIMGLISLSLSILKGVLASIPHNGLYDTAIAGIEAAIAEIEKVKGSEVTFQQLEDLRVSQTF